MDWIHCNNCFGLPDAEKTFYLTSCGHIYCKDCEEQCARSKCKLCGNPCSTIVLSSSLKPDVQMYFIDPDELLKKKLKEVHQLRKFKAVKEDFRKLLKNLKDLDGERKKLAHENDTLKKYIMIQRNATISESSSKGHSKSPYDNTRSNLDSVLSKFIDKSHSGKSERMCVISPPKDGKLGVIYGTPSPSSALQKLNLNASRSIESLQKRAGMPFDSPYSSPASIQTSVFVTPETPASLSQNDLFKSPTDQDSKFLQCQRMSKKKLVVHPFSPND